MSAVDIHIEYLLKTQDQDAHFYEVTESPYSSPLNCQSMAFGSGKHTIRMIDAFGGKRPMLFNLKFLEMPDNYRLELHPTIIMDSHIVSALHTYLSSPNAMKSDQKEATEAFLDFVIKSNIDFNPLFYLIESYCKSSLDNFMKYVPPVLTSLLTLQGMASEPFLVGREVVSRPDAFNHYAKIYGPAETYEECANNWARQFSEDEEMKGMIPLIQATYAAVLKMALIEKKDRKPIENKLEDFENFMTNDLGMRMGRESQLATMYFSGLAGSLIGVQPKSNLENAKRDLKATAWDLFLLRLPEILIGPTHLPEMTLAYIATAEKKLHDLGDIVKIERIMTRSDKRVMTVPVVSMDLSAIKERLSSQTVTNILDANQKNTEFRFASKKINPINTYLLNNLVEDLETQLSYLCKR